MIAWIQTILVFFYCALSLLTIRQRVKFEGVHREVLMNQGLLFLIVAGIIHIMAKLP